MFDPAVLIKLSFDLKNLIANYETKILELVNSPAQRFFDRQLSSNLSQEKDFESGLAFLKENRANLEVLKVSIENIERSSVAFFQENIQQTQSMMSEYDREIFNLSKNQDSFLLKTWFSEWKLRAKHDQFETDSTETHLIKQSTHELFRELNGKRNECLLHNSRLMFLQAMVYGAQVKEIAAYLMECAAALQEYTCKKNDIVEPARMMRETNSNQLVDSFLESTTEKNERCENEFHLPMDHLSANKTLSEISGFFTDRVDNLNIQFLDDPMDLNFNMDSPCFENPISDETSLEQQGRDVSATRTAASLDLKNYGNTRMNDEPSVSRFLFESLLPLTKPQEKLETIFAKYSSHDSLLIDKIVVFFNKNKQKDRMECFFNLAEDTLRTLHTVFKKKLALCGKIQKIVRTEKNGTRKMPRSGTQYAQIFKELNIALKRFDLNNPLDAHFNGEKNVMLSIFSENYNKKDKRLDTGVLPNPTKKLHI